MTPAAGADRWMERGRVRRSMSDVAHDRSVVAAFLRESLVWCELELEKKAARVAAGEAMGARSVAEWRHHAAMLRHSLEEVEAGLLDRWLTDGEGAAAALFEQIRTGVPPIDGAPAAEAAGAPDTATGWANVAPAGRGADAAWFGTWLSPRPVILLSTFGADGLLNLAPLSSLSVVSNAPPLAAVAIGAHAGGRPHDTLVNLERERPSLLLVLPGTPAAAELVDLCAAPLPPDQSEWSLLADGPIFLEDGLPPTHPLAVAAIEVAAVESRNLPGGAAARLVILALQRRWQRVVEAAPTGPVLRAGIEPPPLGLAYQMLPDAGDGPITPPQLLAQVGVDRLVPGPDPADWSRRTTRHRV